MASSYLTIPIAALALALQAAPALAQGGTGTGTPRAAASGKAAAPAAPVREPESRASRILGMDVFNRAGEKVGDIEDLVLDRNGSVAYAIVSTGTYLGVGSRLHAVPWQSLQTDAGADHFVLDIDRDRLGRAPGFDPNDMADLSDRRWGAENRKHFPAAVARSRATTPGSGRGARNDIGPTRATAARTGTAAGAGSVTTGGPGSALGSGAGTASVSPPDRASAGPGGGETPAGPVPTTTHRDDAAGHGRPADPISTGNDAKPQ